VLLLLLPGIIIYLSEI